MNNGILINKYLTRQKFDSDYFGFNIYQLKKLDELTKNILQEIIQSAAKKNIQLITCLINPLNRELIKLLQELGFVLADIKLTYFKDISNISAPSLDLQEINITTDLKQLKSIAKKSFLFSRVFHEYFPKNKSKNWYVTWLVNSINNLQKKIFIAKWENKAAGFIICKKRGTFGIIELIAADRKMQNKGLGTNLIQQSIKWFKENNINKISVSTQAENLRSQIFYQKLGFRLLDIKNWYYKKII